MNVRFKNFAIFLALILSALAIYAWYYPLNKGRVAVSTGFADATIVSDNGTVSCTQDPCEMTLKTGTQKLTAQKEGYLSESVILSVKRGRNDPVQIELKKIPSLQISPSLPPERIEPPMIPESLKTTSMIAPAWTKDGKQLAFIDTGEQKVKVWDGQNVRIITSLKGATDRFTLHWSSDGRYLLGNDGRDLYFLDIGKNSRTKQILDFAPRFILPSYSEDYFLANDPENHLFRIRPVEKIVERIEWAVNLYNAAWKKADLLVFFTYFPNENKTTVEQIDLLTNEKQEIISQYNFLANSIVTDTSGTLFLYRPDTETWYNLNY